VSNPHVHFELRPDLERPAMVTAIRGWNDGGEAASIAVRYLMERWDGARMATLDPEEFVDFQVTRPTVRLEDGVSRVIEWPEGEFTLASPAGRHVVFFTAVEPNMRWRTFSSAVVDTANEIGAETLVTLGAFLTNVPHSRPVPVVGSAPSPEEARGLGLATSQYEGPTGIVGVLHDAANKAGLRSISLWAAVPHYLPVAPNPKAALALVQRLTTLLHTEVELASLQEAAREWEESVGQLLEENDELGAYVQQLEQAVDSGDTEIRITEDIPSGDAIAAELERFLRENESGEETT
jgi:predicted ATP-grasp superfamily ATP-dependent carboligase